MTHVDTAGIRRSVTAEPSLGGGLLRLADGFEIVCQTATEARFLYHDIFEKEIYCRHGVSLDGVETVFDVGANIGMFTLFVGTRCPQAQVYAFEPAPPLFEILRENVGRFGVRAELFHCGVAAAAGTAELTFYPNSSGMSSFHADRKEEEEALRNLMANELREGEPGMEELMEHADDLLAERLRSCTFECALRPLSEVIRERAVERIDLLKVDVQKSELDVVRGVDEEHWPRIRQVVLELHNTDNQYSWLHGFLTERGFQVFAEQEFAYQESPMLNVFASRPRGGAHSPSPRTRQNAREEALSRAEKMKSRLRKPRPSSGGSP